MNILSQYTTMQILASCSQSTLRFHKIMHKVRGVLQRNNLLGKEPFHYLPDAAESLSEHKKHFVDL